MKRIIDLLVSCVGLLLVVPLLLLIAALVRWRLGTPVLFRQTRPGLGGQPFRIVKFRTMTLECSSEGTLLPDEKRVTRVGQFLRATSLDELPAIFNVLRGEMSLVGPRPLLMEYLPLYTPEQAIRHTVRPGLTGWAQINGRNAITWEEKFALDAWYVRHQSLWLDVKILCLTVLKVIRREGIVQEGFATMPKFTGSPVKSGT
ncbi:MAG: sugar transferase [Gemmatimonadaceae bacterium]